MNAIMTRDDILSELSTMKPNARGRRMLEKIAVRLTCEQLQFENELGQALLESLAADERARIAADGVRHG